MCEELIDLLKAGCTPPEAVDYWAVELNSHTQVEWADIRQVRQSSVSENITKARKKLV